MYRLSSKKQFLRSASKLIKKSSSIDSQLSSVLGLLKKDPFHPTLKTHKLKGNLRGFYACSLTHDLRIVFELFDHAISLVDIGSHDEIY